MGAMRPIFDAWGEGMVRAARNLGLTEKEAEDFRPPPEARDAMIGCYVEVFDALGWVSESTGPVLAAIEGIGMTATLYGVPTYQLVQARKRRELALKKAASPRPTTPGPEEPRATAPGPTVQ